MLKKALSRTAFALVAALALQSCTVSEPETPSGDASNLLLKQVTAYGITMINFEYDNQNRVTEINIGKDATYEFIYEKGSKSRIPDKIVNSEYQEFDLNDKPEYVMNEQDVWTNIRGNADGFITSADMETTLWYYGTERDYETDKESLVLEGEHKETSHETWTYTAAGQLLSNKSITLDDMGQTVTDIVDYNWQGGNLISFTDNDPDNPEAGEYEYSDVDNTVGQWDPNNNILGPVAVTGLFGKAPAKFMKSETIRYGNYEDEVYQYAYTLLSNGLINLAKVYDSMEHESMVVKFVYVNAK